jgi:peptide/nickel transport system ATP-binding protein
MMSDLKRQLNTSVVMITHDLGIIAETCDSVAVIYAVRSWSTAPPKISLTGLHIPHDRDLFDSLPKLNVRGKRLKPIKGLMPDPTNLPSGCKFHDRCPFATEECGKTAPAMTEITPGHFVKCHRIEVND